MFFEKPIQFPFHGVVLDIIGDTVHFHAISDNVVMETWLPHKWYFTLVRIFRNGRFEVSDYMRQPTATIGTTSHFFVDFGVFICAAVVIRQPYNQ